MTPEFSSAPENEARAHLLKAFLRLYAHARPEDITVQQIVREANYSRSTFYRHFAGVEHVLESLERENTCTRVCEDIIERVDTIPLEEATDNMAAFYEDRFDAISVLATASNANNWIDLQRQAMKPMFAALLGRGFDMTPLQMDVASEYIASAKAGMFRPWIARGGRISLNQINKMAENLIENELWVFVARQVPEYGGPLPRKVLERHLFEYPWMKD